MHLEPVTYVLRLYAPGDSYEAGSRYIASATMQITGTDAHISGLSGSLSVRHYREFLRQLAGMGCTAMVAARRGELRFKKI